MDTEEVDEYVERSQQLIETSPQMAEENTKIRLIQPFLELLGWNLYSTEVEPEYTVPMASRSTHVDYALLVGDSPVVFVEAKPVRSDLTNENIRQLKSYMRQELDVDWGILTNGKAFEVLTKSRHQNDGEEVSVVRFTLEDLSENPDVLELLSKESIRSGRADEIAEQVARTSQAIHQLQEKEDEITETVADAVENEIGDLTINLEEQSREFVQNLGSALREQRQFVTEGPLIESRGTETESGDGGDNSDSIEPLEDRIAGELNRREIDGDSNAKVAVFPTRESGLPFLKENEAWGFVRIGSEFDYAAMYVTGDVRKVKYFATVDEVVAPDEASLKRDPLDYRDGAKIAEGKMVVKFKTGSLHELKEPIPFETKYPQGLRYTTLGRFKNAKTTDDLF